MSLKQIVGVAVLAALTGVNASVASAITIPTVPVGHPGNAADLSGFGAVAYAYRIGQTEVTNAQYAAFLNAVAATDTNNLYNASMSPATAYGGIMRSGTSGMYSYSAAPERANNPVNYVSFWDSCRFANWLHNGQPTGSQNAGTTEDGAYTLTPSGMSSNSVTRNANAVWALTSENEWYKAAYFQPAAEGGDVDNYWKYPTASNTITTAQANYDNSGSPVAVGSYAANFYGVYDMGGNVCEWNESVRGVSTRALRGGSFFYSAEFMQASRPIDNFPSVKSFQFGFRVVQVPGPSSLGLLALGGLVTTCCRRRPRI